MVLGLWIRVEECVRRMSARRAVSNNNAEEIGTNHGRYGKVEDGQGKVVKAKQRMEGWNAIGLRGDDVRIAMFFLFFVQVGFFGTGK